MSGGCVTDVVCGLLLVERASSADAAEGVRLLLLLLAEAKNSLVDDDDDDGLLLVAS